MVDNPPGEPRRRHIVYDWVNERLYVANAAMNRVDVLAGGNPAVQTTIDAPGAASVDLSVDGTTLWVGTTTEQILAVDTATLHVKVRYAVAGVTPIPNVVFDRPTEVLAMSSGKMLVRLRQSSNAQGLLALWDPAANSFINLTSSAPAGFQNGVGVMARSGDHSRVLIAANDSSGELAVLDGNGAVAVGPQAPLAGTIALAAANVSGTRFTVGINASGGLHVLLLDANLNMLGNYGAAGINGLVFSADSQLLYVAEPYGNGSVISALSASNLQKIGQIPDMEVQGIATGIEEMGAPPFACGLGNRGVAFIDVSKPGSLPSSVPVFASAPAVQPAEGAASGGTALSLMGANFTLNAQVRFGNMNPVSATVASSSQLQVTAPGSVASGPVNVTAYFPNGWLALAPAAFSYGPKIVRVLPNAGTTAGGDTISIFGHGFGNSGNVSVTIGGQSANVISVDTVPSIAATLGVDSSYPFVLERITLKTPQGTEGKVDLVVNSSTGSTALPKAFQYLGAAQKYANAGLHKFIVYDQSRQHLYLSATDHVDVFDLEAKAFVNPINPPPNGPPPNAGLRGLSITPDHSQLAIADFGAQSVYLVYPDGAANNGTAVFVGGVAGFSASGPARVTATSAQTVFVGLSGEGGGGACNNCLGQMNLLASPPSFQPAPQAEVTAVTGAPLIQADTPGDTAYLAYKTAPGGPLATWSAATPDAFSVSTARDIGQ